MSSAHKSLIGKWALKKWYIVHAPPIFKCVEIGEVPADSPEKLLNRTIEVSLFELTRDLSHIPIKLKFQIYRVEGDHAYTRFKQQELTRDYVRSLVRRGSSKIVTIHDVTTPDGAKMRIQVLAVTAYRCNTSHKRAIRAITRSRLDEFAKYLKFDDYILALVFGAVAQDVLLHAKKIYPLRKVEILKVKVLDYPEPLKKVEVVEKPAIAETTEAEAAQQ